MFRRRLSRYRTAVARELTRAFEAEHTPHQVAASFAVGVFVTAMPTGGLGIGLFFLLVRLWPWVDRVAIFASVLVLNPLVKPLVYAVSLQIGVLVFGIEPITPFGVTALDYAATVLALLLFGNLLVALVLSATSYLLVRELTVSYRRRRADRSLSRAD